MGVFAKVYFYEKIEGLKKLFTSSVTHTQAVNVIFEHFFETALYVEIVFKISLS
jgi:hypothetical protein